MTVMSLICLIVGTVSAAASLVCVRLNVILEFASGIFFLSGLLFIGAGLPLFR